MPKKRGRKPSDIADIPDEQPTKKAKKSSQSTDEKPETVFSKDKPKTAEKEAPS